MVWPSAWSVWLHSFEFGLLMVGNLTSVGALLPTSGAFVASITVKGDSTTIAQPFTQCIRTYYKYTYSNILTNLDYVSEGVRNLVRGQIDRALSTRRWPSTQCPVNLAEGQITKSKAVYLV